MVKMKIIFVCSGNTCRSPMAEYILKNKIKFAGIKGVKVKSAGLSTEDGLPMSENSFNALKLLGVKPYGFKSRRLKLSDVDKADLILCMTNMHKFALKDFTDKVKTISEYTGIEEVTDPYGKDIMEYIKTSHLLEDACNIILEKILEMQKGDKK